MLRLAAYFFSDVFPLNLSSNNLYSEYILTICFGYNMEQYFPIIFEDSITRLIKVKISLIRISIKFIKI